VADSTGHEVAIPSQVDRVGPAIDFGLDGIGHQLADRLLAVPEYQRSYSWGDVQIDDFCLDLAAAYKATPREYFLGTIVLSKEGGSGRVTVIDGQQRLATTTLLLAAIRDYFADNGQGTRGDNVHKKYIGSYDDLTDSYEPRLSLNVDDDAFFRDRIVNRGTVAPSRDSHDLILRAYDKVKAFVARLAADAGTSWELTLVEWRKFIEEKLRVIHVTVPTESDAYLIFETLNDRGLDLTLADLLQNYLFGKAGAARLAAVRSSWTNAKANLDNDASLFITFLRHHWSSVHGATRERDLYKAIKGVVMTSQTAATFAKDVEKSSRTYAALLDPSDAFWNVWGTTTKESLAGLGKLGLEQNRPLLLAAVNHLPRAHAKRVLKASVSWAVRGLIVGGIGGGGAERAYCEGAVNISNGSVTTAPQVLAAIAAVVPMDAVFKDAFKIARVSKHVLSRYYLNALERGKSGDPEPELVPNANEDEVTLEHVLPKNAVAAQWPTFNAEDRRNYVNRLGNHALLKRSHNNGIGNEPFSVKKPVLYSSSLPLTKEIGSQADWTPAEIEARQDRLAKIAVSVWKRNP